MYGHEISTYRKKNITRKEWRVVQKPSKPNSQVPIHTSSKAQIGTDIDGFTLVAAKTRPRKSSEPQQAYVQSDQFVSNTFEALRVVDSDEQQQVQSPPPHGKRHLLEH